MGAIAFSATLAAGSASARVVEHDTFHGTYGPEISFCGDPFQQQGVTDGRFLIVERGPQGQEYYMERATFTDTWTNVETGQLVTWVGQYAGRDHKLTNHSDGTMSDLIQITGKSVMYSEDGTVLAREAGMFRFELTFDQNGDFVSRRDVSSAGLQFDFCGTLENAIG